MYLFSLINYFKNHYAKLTKLAFFSSRILIDYSITKYICEQASSILFCNLFKKDQYLYGMKSNAQLK